MRSAKHTAFSALIFAGTYSILVGVGCYFFLQCFEVEQAFWLYGLVLIAAYIVWYIWKEQSRENAVGLPTLNHVQPTTGLVSIFRHAPMVLRITGLTLLLFTLARPRVTEEFWEDSYREALDIILSVDISGSMLSQDFTPNRLEASRRVALKFIENRPTDRIGLAIYRGTGYLQCPLTTDHRNLARLFNEVHSDMLSGGTSITAGINYGVDALAESKSKNKILILLTDGVHEEPGEAMSPEMAADIAATHDVRIYTIGIGTNGKAKTPVAYSNGRYIFEYRDVKIDEELLQKVAETTNGRYFRATDKKELKKIYAEIDKLEKTRIKITEHKRKPDAFFSFAIAAVCCLLLEFILRHTSFKSITA